MALVRRVYRLFRADINAVLDRMEEPEVLLRQAMRDMEEVVARDERRAALMELELAQLAGRQKEIESGLVEIGDELDLCFDTGNLELARVLLKRKLESERLAKHLSARHEDTCESARALYKRIEKNRAELESMREKAELLAVRESNGDASALRAETDCRHRFTVTDDDIELAFLREQQKRAQP
ncbi:MAG: hypothetical protein Kow006_06090 [Gammaproteobacteria bacterium]